MPSDGPIGRLDARVKLVATVAYVVAVVLTPPAFWPMLAVEAGVLAVAVVLSRTSPIALARRWLGFLAPVAFLAAMVAQGHPDRSSLGFARVFSAIVAKNSLAFAAMMVLAQVTTSRALVAAMARLGMPTAIVATLQLMDRQVAILSDELRRMTRARRSRTFRGGGRLGLGTRAGLIGMLFLRSFERGERVHSAMLARGWDGTPRSLEGADDR